jgi:hypothetical protein
VRPKQPKPPERIAAGSALNGSAAPLKQLVLDRPISEWLTTAAAALAATSLCRGSLGFAFDGAGEALLLATFAGLLPDAAWGVEELEGSTRPVICSGTLLVRGTGMLFGAAWVVEELEGSTRPVICPLSIPLPLPLSVVGRTLLGCLAAV